MNRISGIYFQESTSHFTSLQNDHVKLLKKVSSQPNVYFHADGNREYTNAARIYEDSKSGQHIAWVGNVHNRVEIIDFLKQFGIYTNIETSDAQLVLHLYNCVGHSVPLHLIGYYAFAIWDASIQHLFLSRDALGAERLYYHCAPNLFCWGTEIRQVCCLGSIEPSLNEEWIGEALTWSWDGCLVHTQDSPIQDVKSIPPGYSLVLNDEKTPQLIQWWEWEKYKDRKTPKEDVLIEQFRNMLSSSVKNCLGEDPRVLADLSGGLDSSSVVSVACQLSENGESSVQLRDVVSFVDQNESRFDDTKYQEAVVKRYGLNWHKLSISGKWYLQGIQDQDTYFDYPNPILLWQSLARAPMEFAAQHGIGTYLTGVGGDNILFSIPIYLFDYIRSGRFGTALKEIVSLSNLKSRPLLKIISENILTPIKHWHTLWHPKIPKWINPEFLQQTHLKDRLVDRYRTLRGYPLLTQMSLIAIRYSSDRVFTYGKHISEQYGVSFRHPFMDLRLIDFALQIPPDFRLQSKKSKYILRQAMNGILPDTVRLRRGGGNFSHFRRQGMVNEKDAFYELFEKNPVIAQLGFVDIKHWQEELARYRLGVVDNWTPTRPKVSIDFSMALEVWLRTCLPQFDKAYSQHNKKHEEYT